MLKGGVKKDEQPVEQAVDAAIGLTGFGKFSILFMILCALIEFNGGLSMTNIALITPSAACDFNLTTVDKGIMSATPMMGMLAGSYFWGCFADLKGRRFTLAIVLFAEGLFEIIGGLISNYYGYCIFKFLNGFALGGQVMTLPTFIGEYFSSSTRQRILSTINVARPIGAIASRALGWIILPLEISYTNNYFFFRSWNLLVLVYGSLAPILGLWLLTFPETPKYLANAGNDEQLARALRRMHSENTGKSFEDYLEKLNDNGYSELAMRLEIKQKLPMKIHMSKWERTTELYRTIYKRTLTLLKPPFLSRTSIVLPLMFCLTASHMSLALWFPEVFRRFAKFEESHPNESAWMCSVAARNLSSDNPTMQVCPAQIPTSVYVNSLFITLTDLPAGIICMLLVGWLGPKILLIGTTVCSVIVTISLFFVNSSVENLVASAFFDTLTGTAIGLSVNIIVDLYPTHMRTMATGLGILMARVGSTSGNLLIGNLIDHHCTSFMVCITVALSTCVILASLIPRRRLNQHL